MTNEKDEDGIVVSFDNGTSNNNESEGGLSHTPSSEPITRERKKTQRKSIQGLDTLSAETTNFELQEEAENEKFKTLEGFFTPDFPFCDLFTRGWVFLAAAKHIALLLSESLVVAGCGILYLYALSSIPFTNDGDTWYYKPMLVAFFCFLTLFLVVVVIGYGFFVLLYGFKKTIPLLYWTVLPGTIASCLFFIFVAGRIEPWFYALDLVFFGLLGVFFYNSVRVVANAVFPGSSEKDKASKKELILAYLVPLAIHTVIIALYTYVVIPFYRTMEEPLYKGVFRLVIHPVLCQINLSVAQFFCKQYPQVAHHLTIGVVFGVWVETAMLGRFMISTAGTTLDSVGIAAAVGAIEILVRAMIKKKEHIVNHILYKITGKVDYNEKKELAYMAQFNNNIMVVDFISIMVIPFLLHFFYPHKLLFNFSYDPTPVPVVNLAQSAIAQFCIDLVVHFVCILIESHLGIPDIKVWRQHRGVYILWEIINYIQILTLIIYTFKTLPATFFCESLDPCSCGDDGYQGLALLHVMYCLETPLSNNTMM